MDNTLYEFERKLQLVKPNANHHGKNNCYRIPYIKGNWKKIETQFKKYILLQDV